MPFCTILKLPCFLYVGSFLIAPMFLLSTPRSLKHIGNIFAFNNPSVWNYLPNLYIHTYYLIHKEMSILNSHKSINTLVLISLWHTGA